MIRATFPRTTDRADVCVPGDKHGFPLGTLFTPWTVNVPVSSISSSESLSSWTSRTVPCIHTGEAARERPLLSLTTYESPQPCAVLSWLDKTLTGGGRFFSVPVGDMTNRCGGEEEEDAPNCRICRQSLERSPAPFRAPSLPELNIFDFKYLIDDNFQFNSVDDSLRQDCE